MRGLIGCGDEIRSRRGLDVDVCSGLGGRRCEMRAARGGAGVWGDKFGM